MCLLCMCACLLLTRVLFFLFSRGDPLFCHTFFFAIPPQLCSLPNKKPFRFRFSLAEQIILPTPSVSHSQLSLSSKATPQDANENPGWRRHCPFQIVLSSRSFCEIDCCQPGHHVTHSASRTRFMRANENALMHTSKIKKIAALFFFSFLLS